MKNFDNQHYLDALERFGKCYKLKICEDKSAQIVQTVDALERFGKCYKLKICEDKSAQIVQTVEDVRKFELSLPKIWRKFY